MLVLPLTLSEMGTIQTSLSHVKKLASPKFYLALGTWKLLSRLFSQPDWQSLGLQGWGAINPWKSPYLRKKFRSRPSGNGRGGGHPDPEIGEGAVSKKFISALWASVWSKNKGGGGLPWIHRWNSSHWTPYISLKNYKRSKHFSSGYHFINSHNLFSWSCTDFVRRKLMLVTLRTQCKSQFHTW